MQLSWFWWSWYLSSFESKVLIMIVFYKQFPCVCSFDSIVVGLINYNSYNIFMPSILSHPLPSESFRKFSLHAMWSLKRQSSMVYWPNHWLHIWLRLANQKIPPHSNWLGFRHLTWARQYNLPGTDIWMRFSVRIVSRDIHFLDLLSWQHKLKLCEDKSKQNQAELRNRESESSEGIL